MNSVAHMFLEKINLALKLSNLENKTNNLKNRYLLTTVDLYIKNADDIEFQRVIAQEGFLYELDTIVSKTNCEKMLKKYNDIKIDFTPERIEYGYCCETKMTVRNGEYICSICSKCEPYYDDNDYKKCRKRRLPFNYKLYFHKWMLWIQGMESINEIGSRGDPYGEKLLNNIQYSCNDKLLTIYDVRTTLKKIGRSDLNKHASLILYKLTGIKPPEIPIELYQSIENMFYKILQQKQSETRIYYPFYIYQIIDKILPEHDSKRSILEFIPMQSDITWNKNLEKWEEIYDNISYMFDV